MKSWRYTVNLPVGFVGVPICRVARHVGPLILVPQVAARRFLHLFPVLLPQRVGYRFSHNLRGGFATEVWRRISGLREDILCSALDGVRGCGFAEVGQHHCGRPDLPVGLPIPFPEMS
jgi:hypothetical protein